MAFGCPLRHDGAMTAPRRGAAAAVAIVAVALSVLLPQLAGSAWAASPEWNISRIGAPASAAGVVIAIVDTGVDAAHPAFTGRVLNAIDLVDGTGGDANGHGTHVAGTAAGADNGCGAIGVAPDARILPVRVLDEDGAGSASVVADGIRRAADAGAAIINLSLGTDVAVRNVAGSGLEEAIRYAWGKGSIPVLAAGNDGIVGDVFGGSGYGDIPAVVVTATDNQDEVAPYATTIGSAQWGIAAPGGDASEEPGRDILSAFPDRRCALQAGTSMAAPHVSGALAALRAKGLNSQQAVDRLIGTARDLGREGPDATYGHGLVDLRAALGGPSPPTTVAATPAAPPTSAATTSSGSPAPASPAPAGTPGAPASEAAPSAPGPSDPTQPESDDPLAAEDGTAEDATSPTRPSVPAGGSASPVVVRDDDGGGDGPPGALVAVAVAALAASGVGAGVFARTIGRRSGAG